MAYWCGLVCVVTCLVLHAATFFTVIPPIWILVPFALMFASMLCFQAFRRNPTIMVPNRKAAVLSAVLLAYGVGMLRFAYRATGGASSVAVVNAEYVSMYKDHVLRVLNADEFRRYPNLWTRAFTAWTGMIAALTLIGHSEWSADIFSKGITVKRETT